MDILWVWKYGEERTKRKAYLIGNSRERIVSFGSNGGSHQDSQLESLSELHYSCDDGLSCIALLCASCCFMSVDGERVLFEAG